MLFNRLGISLGVEKKVIENYSLYVISNALSVFIPLLVTPYIIRNYSIETFGLISFQQILMLFIALLFDNGIRLYTIRHLSVNRENAQELQKVFNVFMNYKIIVCLVVSLFYISYVILFTSPNMYTVSMTSMLVFYGSMLSPAFLFVAIEDFQWKCEK
jgi:O-antigen/teichoic acid export membrane protein